jgi:hypothetical protein
MRPYAQSPFALTAHQALDFLHPHGLGSMGWSGGRGTGRLILWLDVHFEFMNDHCHILCSFLKQWPSHTCLHIDQLPWL